MVLSLWLVDEVWMVLRHALPKKRSYLEELAEPHRLLYLFLTRHPSYWYRKAETHVLLRRPTLTGFEPQVRQLCYLESKTSTIRDQ